MAFRYRREGQFIKLRKHFEQSGIRPWIDEFKWEVTSWHYQYWMGPQVKDILHKQNKAALGLRGMLQRIASGQNVSKYITPTEQFYFVTALPQTVPYRQNSNPFCPVSANKTGWKEWKPKLIPYPTVKGRHQIGGTVVTPPNFPRFR